MRALKISKFSRVKMTVCLMSPSLSPCSTVGRSSSLVVPASICSTLEPSDFLFFIFYPRFLLQDLDNLQRRWSAGRVQRWFSRSLVLQQA